MIEIIKNLWNRQYKYDPFLLIPVYLLIIISLTITKYTESSVLFDRKIITIIIGSIFIYFLQKIPIFILQKYLFILYIIGIILLILTKLFGKSIGGIQSWLLLNDSFTFQPSYYSILTTLILISNILAKTNISNYVKYIRIIFYLLIPLALIFTETDLKSTFILFSSNISLYIIHLFNIRNILFYLLSLILIYLIIYLILILILNTPIQLFFPNYQIERIKNFISKEKKILNNTDQPQILSFKSTILIIDSSISEEFGFFGFILVIILYLIIILRGIYISNLQISKFESLLSSGINLYLFNNIILNILIIKNISSSFVNVNLNVNFPFISYSNSKLIVNMIMIGILNSIK